MSSIVNPTGMKHATPPSVGIDVGTTTTQVIFSALEVTNRAGGSGAALRVLQARDPLPEPRDLHAADDRSRWTSRS